VTRNRPPQRARTAGLVVEGETEFIAFPRLHREARALRFPPIKAVNLGGIGATLTPAAVAARVAPKVLAHHQRALAPIVVCFDRESREEPAGEFAADVHAATTAWIEKRTDAPVEFSVVVADRAFEAWILADAHGLHGRGRLMRAPKFRSFEGAMGQRSRKGVVELSRLLGRDYRKTVDGPDLFVAVDFVTARAPTKHGGGSASLDRLLTSLGL